MRFAVFSDLHAHNYKEFDVDGSRLKNCMNVLHNVFDIANENKIYNILFTGDLYDQQKAIPTSVVDAVIEHLMDLFNQYPHIALYAVSGNHDQASKNLIHQPAVTALKHLQRIFPNNFVLLDNDFVTLDPKESRPTTVYGIPYYEYPKEFDQKLQELCDSFDPTDLVQYKVLMIHQTPADIDNPNIPADFDPRDERLQQFDLVLCGHIHRKKEIAMNFLLVGSPLHRDAGDEGDDKGMWVVDTESPMKKDFIELNYPQIMYVEEGQESAWEHNYVKVVPAVQHDEDALQANVEEFRSDLGNKELVTNYWNEVDGKDKKLLEVGLSFV